MGFVDTAAAINTKVCQEDLGTQADCWECKKDGDGKKIRGGDRTLDRFPIFVPRSNKQGQSLPSRLQFQFHGHFRSYFPKFGGPLHSKEHCDFSVHCAFTTHSVTYLCSDEVPLTYGSVSAQTKCH